jgi:ubiquinol-cytochrome c reductase cytochrome b subunit
MGRLKESGIAAYEWLEHRLGLIKPISEAASHPTPSNNASWWYVFGSAATVLLILQVMTGILAGADLQSFGE